jgi:regulator of nucleoside diphosphate kinase
MTERRKIYATEHDVRLLEELIRDAGATQYRGSRYLDDLRDELDRAVIVKSTEIPGDVITMNSKVSLEDTQTGEEIIFTLVYPEDANLLEDKISILAPMGTAALGYRVGDRFEWETPDGIRSLRVRKILYQPEASGDYHL